MFIANSERGMNVQTTKEAAKPLAFEEFADTFQCSRRSLIAEINDFRFEERRESQADAVRELIKIGLQSWRKQRAKSVGKAGAPCTRSALPCTALQCAAVWKQNKNAGLSAELEMG
jgi:hypothetical protein